MSAVSAWQLSFRQSLPLDAKIFYSLRRIRGFVNHMRRNVYVSFSGGKDSTVLLHLVRQIYPKCPAVFVDTGLEYPEIREFVNSVENVIWVKPKVPFTQVIRDYGFPVVSKEVSEKVYEIRTTKSEKLKNKRLNGDKNGNGKLPTKWVKLVDLPFKISSMCCDKLKKEPVKTYEKDTKRFPFVGTMADDSRLRKTSYLNKGCNSFSGERPLSTPMGFWMENDVWDYLDTYQVPYSKIYDMGYDRTGCMFCMFGLYMEQRPHRFDKMQHTHTQQFNYCMNQLGLRDVIEQVHGAEMLAPYQKSLFEE